jgi:hypothetical protein
MDRLREFVPILERILGFLEKLETAHSKISGLEERFDNLEIAFEDLRTTVTREPPKELYSTHEFAKIVERKPFTVREWCRLGRIRGQKAMCGRGETSEWRVPHEELIRYRNEGLLPMPQLAAWR